MFSPFPVWTRTSLPPARYNLHVGSGSHGSMTGKMLAEIERVFVEERPAIALVQGDTNTVLAGALVAAKLHIPTGHVEAGLRSYDRRMPEEINRVVADHVGTHLFAPTEGARRILLNEGVAEENIAVTGNTIADVVLSLSQRGMLDEARVDVLIVAAGMDGALPSVVSGLVDVPVVGLPTSVGYGLGGRGEAALLSMLQTCAPGMAVVNIDNGIGAGAMAGLIALRVAAAREG